MRSKGGVWQWYNLNEFKFRERDRHEVKILCAYLELYQGDGTDDATEIIVRRLMGLEWYLLKDMTRDIMDELERHGPVGKLEGVMSDEVVFMDQLIKSAARRMKVTSSAPKRKPVTTTTTRWRPNNNNSMNRSGHGNYRTNNKYNQRKGTGRGTDNSGSGAGTTS